MKKAIKKKWLKALRSGKYKQTEDKLKDKKGFCCLGVLCDIHRKENKKRWLHNSYYDEDLTLPEEIVSWSGLPSYNPIIDYRSNTLADLNDEGKTFEEIADVIEKQF